jgi:hypothetical protein
MLIAPLASIQAGAHAHAKNDFGQPNPTAAAMFGQELCTMPWVCV